jgi:hypothetical protein
MLGLLCAQCFIIIIIIIIIIICINIVIITTNLSTKTCFDLCRSSSGYSQYKEFIFSLFLCVWYLFSTKRIYTFCNM